MKRFFIIAIVAVLLIAIIIRNCNNSESYDVDENVECYSLRSTISNNEENVPLTSDSRKTTVAVKQELPDNVPKTQNDALFEIVKLKVSKPEQILKRIGYTTSYNHDTKCPNWVAWHLTAEHTDGPFSRKGVPYYSDYGNVYGLGNVTPETCKNGYFVDMEANEPRQQLSDWTNEYNMSHGHMCPAGDNKWDKAAMNQSFLLTNMCPQDGKLNGGGWKKLEEKCRLWANQYGDIYIVAGPIFHEPISRTLGNGRIAVPDAFFKVILCMHGNPKAIGFLYKNDSSSQSMKDNVYSVDDIENISGFDFFHFLPDNIENSIESVSNINKW